MTVTVSLLAYAVVGYERSVGPDLLWPAGKVALSLTRYTVIPAQLLLAAWLVLIDHARSAGRRAWPFGLAWIAAVAVISFPIGDRSLRGQPAYSRELDSAQRRCDFRAVG